MEIWEAVLDDKYACSVHRIDEYRGILKIEEFGLTDKILLEKDVTLSYNAQFGPDIADINLWEEICIEFVDSQC